MNLEFNWKFGDYEIHACPKRLVRFNDETNETIDFVKFNKSGSKKYCYSIAYFEQDKEGFWDLVLVGERFWDEVPEEDWNTVMNALAMAHTTLNKCCSSQSDFY